MKFDRQAGIQRLMKKHIPAAFSLRLLRFLLLVAAPFAYSVLLLGAALAQEGGQRWLSIPIGLAGLGVLYGVGLFTGGKAPTLGDHWAEFLESLKPQNWHRESRPLIFISMGCLVYNLIRDLQVQPEIPPERVELVMDLLLALESGQDISTPPAGVEPGYHQQALDFLIRYDYVENRGEGLKLTQLARDRLVLGMLQS